MKIINFLITGCLMGSLCFFSNSYASATSQQSERNLPNVSGLFDSQSTDQNLPSNVSAYQPGNTLQNEEDTRLNRIENQNMSVHIYVCSSEQVRETSVIMSPYAFSIINAYLQNGSNTNLSQFQKDLKNNCEQNSPVYQDDKSNQILPWLENKATSLRNKVSVIIFVEGNTRSAVDANGKEIEISSTGSVLTYPGIKAKVVSFILNVLKGGSSKPTKKSWWKKN